MELNRSGIGLTPGGTPTPLQRELETTAWTEINKAALGIVPDSIEQPFIQANPLYTQGYLGGFGYKCSADQPLLDHPLESVRMLQTFESIPDDSWRATYGTLVSCLPLELQIKLEVQNSIPFEARSYAFVALDNILAATARMLVVLESMSQPAPTGSLVEARTEINRLLPLATLMNSISIGGEVGQMAFNYLEQLGANYRNFDAISNMLNQMHSGLSALYLIKDTISNSSDSGAISQAKQQAGRVAQLFTDLGAALEHQIDGNDLQLLRATSHALAMVAASLSLPISNSAPLFISLSIGLIGMNAANNHGGLLGANFSQLIHSLLNGISIERNTLAGHQLIQMACTAGFTLLMGIAFQIAENGIGTFPNSTIEDRAAAHSLVFSAALQLLAGSEFLNIFFNELLAVAGGKAYGS